MNVVSLIVVIDNCSTDDSYSILKKIESFKVVVLRSNRNGGYGYGNNFGMSYIETHFPHQYVIISNPDIDVNETVLINMLEFISKHKDAAIVAPVQRLYHAQGKILPPWKLVTFWKTVFSASILFSKLFKINLSYDENYYMNKECSEVDVVQGAFFAFNMTFFKKIGGYDQNIFLYNEEECIAQKLKCINKKSYILGTEYYIHHHSVSVKKNIGNVAKIKKLQLRSKLEYIYTYFKNISIPKKLAIRIFFAYCILEAEIIVLVKNICRR